MGISLPFFEQTRFLKLNVWNPKTDGLSLGSWVVKRAHKFSGMHVGMSGSTLAPREEFMSGMMYRGPWPQPSLQIVMVPFPLYILLFFLSRPLIWWPIMESCAPEVAVCPSFWSDGPIKSMVLIIKDNPTWMCLGVAWQVLCGCVIQDHIFSIISCDVKIASN